jgi:hypothetical protein
VYSEASSLLYSKNCFQFLTVWHSGEGVYGSAYIAPFFHQIRSQASLIRHIYIFFPGFDDFKQVEPTLAIVHFKSLKLIQDICTNLATLKLLVPPNCDNRVLYDSTYAQKAQDLLDARFRAILSLKKVIINFQLYNDKDLVYDLTKMRDLGWTIEITILPKRIWISDDNRVEFDNEEDCQQ